MTVDLAAVWNASLRWEEFYRAEMQHYKLWSGVYDRVVVPGWASTEFANRSPLRFLVLAEDWCGDAANTVPVVVRLTQVVAELELRIVLRDTHPEVMDQYLTNGSRSIPIVIAANQDFEERGHWGPRPSELQAWVQANKVTIPKPERYAYTRRWYAQDRGETTLRELLAAIDG